MNSESGIIVMLNNTLSTWVTEVVTPLLSVTVQCTQTLFHAQNYYKYFIKLSLVYVYKVYMKHKWISFLDLGPIPRHFIMCKQIFQNLKKSKTFLVPTIADKGYSICMAKFYPFQKDEIILIQCISQIV